jgi:hypothetical protein
LVSDVAAAAAVVLVDAAVDAAEVRFEPVAATPAYPPGLSHDYDLRDLLALALRLEGSVPAAWQVAIPAEAFGVGAGLSARCAAALAEALRVLAERLPR